MDSICRMHQLPFAQALTADLFGFEPQRWDARLDGWHCREQLRRPHETIRVRHTIGMLDPLQESALDRGHQVTDSMPCCLVQDIVQYGVRDFKVKVSGVVKADQRRLLAIAEVLTNTLGEDWQVTLDGNEQFETMAGVAQLLETLRHDPLGLALLQRLRYVEQPIAREATFRETCLTGLAQVQEYAPVILDEADAGLFCMRRAVALGYDGISVKNCKGVFRGLAHRALVDLYEGAFLASEDLTNLPVIALQQDLTVAACLGLGRYGEERTSLFSRASASHGVGARAGVRPPSRPLSSVSRHCPTSH